MVAPTPLSAHQSSRVSASGRFSSGTTWISEAIRTTLSHRSMLQIGSPE